MLLASSTYEWPNHVVNDYNSLTTVNKIYFTKLTRYQDLFYKIAFPKIGYHYLPKIYIPFPDNPPKAINGIRTVSVQQMIHLFGSFRSVMTELKQIINNKHWNTAWVMLVFYRLGWFIIENIFWKKK